MSENDPQVNDCRRMIQDTLQNLEIGKTLSHRNLEILPLCSGNGHSSPRVLLKDALESGGTVVTEVDEGGSVPDLTVENSGPDPFLILAGDELIGAKQNRIVNITIIIAAKSKIRIPVTCVEQGRWAYRSKRFSAGRKANVSLRRAAESSIRRSVRKRGDHVSDQGQVWDEVSEMHADLAACSPTGAMGDSFDHVAEPLTEFKEHLPCPDKANGIAAFIDGALVTVELFDHPDTLRKVWESHVESYAIDALRTGGTGQPEPSSKEQVTEFTQRIARSLEEPRTSVGLGEEVGIKDGDLVGSALVHEGQLVHLQTFLGATPDDDADDDDLVDDDSPPRVY